MGGGDLNLKKSWHPQTLKNIERVWKAEQRHDAERKKIEELQKELRAERAREEMTKYAQETGALKKKDDRLDWMYQGPQGHINREEYLLGRPIDKQITQQYEEPESGPSAETGLLPGSIFNPTMPASTQDMAAKIREDPLFSIRKREEEKKKSLLTNPVQMKMIKEMLRENLEKGKKKSKKDKKEKRKEKAKRQSRSDESSSCDERKPRHRYSSPPSSISPVRSRYGLQLPAKRHHDSRYSSRSQRNSSSRSESRNSNLPSNTKERERAWKRPATSHTKHLSSEELERKRQEMMNFAREREEERFSSVRKYQHQEEEEKRRNEKHGHDAGFIHDMKLESAASSSLEDRVKRKIHSLQRTPAALEKNFMKR